MLSAIPDFVMIDLKKQRIFIKCCFRLGVTVSETEEMLKTTFGDSKTGENYIFQWFFD
jgi:hypothetical protein